MDQSEDVIIDWVDENDEVMGPISRKNIFRENASFRTSHIFVFNGKGELLLQRIAASRERYPGRLGSSVAGYVLSGETYEQAARRKLMDELGISINDAKLETVGKTHMEDEGRRKFVTLFKTEYTGALKPDPEQMDEVVAMSLEKLDKKVAENPEEFTPTFLHVLEYYKSQN